MTQTATLETQAPKAGYAMDDVRANVDPRPQLESEDYRPAGKLEGKAALVTGGDSGIGAAAAIAFAKEGADVALVYYVRSCSRAMWATRSSAAARWAASWTPGAVWTCS